ncbi:MAG TPA: hypothetical protein VGE74_23905 [Gemmata sp.]
MDGRRLLELAQKLVDGVATGTPLTGGDGAPECRSAISRAYYATFLVASALLDRIGFAVQNSPAAHAAVQYALNNSGDAALRAVASDLDSLHRDRRRADYDPRDKSAQQRAKAEEATQLAARIIARLDEVRDAAAPERLGAIASAVSVWLKGAKSAGLRQKSGAH